MSDPDNCLILRLPKAERGRLLDQCEPFELQRGVELSERGRPLSHAYFPRSGFVSLVIDLESHPPLEVGMVGRETMLGSELILQQAPAPWRALVQSAGQAWRIEAAALRQQATVSPQLQQMLKTCLLIRLHQQSLSTACVRFHLIGPRLARWLLMFQDRAGSDSFEVTQEFIALMLGVRRVGVTVAAGELQDSGVISYRRGRLVVLDRAELERRACSCYAADQRVYDELSGLHRLPLAPPAE
ncbi:MAG: Crp/Fnr family transcriptional regulator [Hydrogenophaga sp.]|nr:Crp/Fnr family transcriptional regulator [Hydrogenophaga sp.]